MIPLWMQVLVDAAGLTLLSLCLLLLALGGRDGAHAGQVRPRHPQPPARHARRRLAKSPVRSS